VNIEKAKIMVKHVASDRKRWGKNADFGSYHQADVLDALVMIHDEGYLDFQGEDFAEMKKALTKANRQRAAADARAKKYHQEVDYLQSRNREIIERLEEKENTIANLRIQLQESLDA